MESSIDSSSNAPSLVHSVVIPGCRLKEIPRVLEAAIPAIFQP